MSFNPNSCPHCEEKFKTKQTRLEYLKMTLNVHYHCDACSNDWFVSCKIKNKIKIKKQITVPAPVVKKTIEKPNTIVNESEIVKYIEKQEQASVNLSTAFAEAFRLAQENKNTIWLCTIDEDYHTFVLEPNQSVLSKLGKTVGECWKINQEGTRESFIPVESDVGRRPATKPLPVISERRSFVLKAILGYAMANRSGINEYFTDGDRISVGGIFGDFIEEIEIDKLISSLTNEKAEKILT